MTFDDEITAALRRDLQGAHVGFDAAGAEDMIRVATQGDPLGERRAYAAPLAAAAAVVAIGGGVATFAATRDSGTPTGGGPNAPAYCVSTTTAPAGISVSPYLRPLIGTLPPTTVPPLPTAAPSTSYVDQPTPTTPATATATAEPPSTSAVPAPPEVTFSASEAPTPVPSTSPTDDPCATSDTPSATSSDEPTAVPSTPEPSTAASACSPLDIDPGFSGCITFDVRATVAPGAGSASFPIPNVPAIPSSSHFTVLTYDVENPGTNSGTVTIEQDNTIIARHRFLAASTSPVLSVDSPIEISTGRPAVVRLSCESTTTRCGVRVLVAARIVPSSSSTETTPVPTATHT